MSTGAYVGMIVFGHSQLAKAQNSQPCASKTSTTPILAFAIAACWREVYHTCLAL